jgi:hypothetical protein
MISELTVRMVQTMQLSHYLQMDRNEILHDPRHLGVSSGASKMIFELTVRSVQTMLLC